MTVLIVDDQVTVVSGIISGIKWNEIFVAKVLKAYSAMEAKKLIKEEKIDIMLCHIEMPVEDGLSLYRYIKEQGYEIECIFLTAHADFEFAREAIKLGGFDYILQPARYEEVQNAVLRAQQKIRTRKEVQKYSSYGQVLYQKRDILLDGIIKNWFLGKEVELDAVVADLLKLQVYLKSESPIHYVLIHIMRWVMGKMLLEGELLRHTLHNILAELFEECGCEILLVQLNTADYALLVYTIDDKRIDNKNVKKTLERFIELCYKFFGCAVAAYMGDTITMDGVSAQMEKLIELKYDNVAQLSHVFSLEKGGIAASQPDSSNIMNTGSRR